MTKIRRADPADHVFDISADLSISSRQTEPGPPRRVAGMTMGVVTMDQSAPHGGEVHPDGDELLYVISGSLLVIGDSDPDTPLVLREGEACIVPAGEWHQVQVLEKSQFIHLTPGPNGDHRPIKTD